PAVVARSPVAVGLLLLCSPPRPLLPPLFPYTTLFRSQSPLGDHVRVACQDRGHRKRRTAQAHPGTERPRLAARHVLESAGARLRSEEHTSELQSRENLVCRLLLEKKNAVRQHGTGHDH